MVTTGFLWSWWKGFTLRDDAENKDSPGWHMLLAMTRLQQPKKLLLGNKNVSRF